MALSCSFTPNERISVLQGNAVVLRFILCMDGTPVQNLGSAIGGSFQALGHRDNVVGAEKDWLDLRIDDPQTGVISVPLTSQDTEHMSGEYDLSVEVQWGPADVIEWRFPRTLNIIRDHILFENT